MGRDPQSFLVRTLLWSLCKGMTTLGGDRERGSSVSESTGEAGTQLCPTRSSTAHWEPLGRLVQHNLWVSREGDAPVS